MSIATSAFAKSLHFREDVHVYCKTNLFFILRRVLGAVQFTIAAVTVESKIACKILPTKTEGKKQTGKTAK